MLEIVRGYSGKRIERSVAEDDRRTEDDQSIDQICCEKRRSEAGASFYEERRDSTLAQLVQRFASVVCGNRFHAAAREIRGQSRSRSNDQHGWSIARGPRQVRLG